jgi:hypothetical protein
MKNLLWITGALAFVLLVVFVAQTPITPFPADAGGTNQDLSMDAGTVVQNYYAALNGAGLDRAIDLLPDDIVIEFQLLPTTEHVKYSGIEAVQVWLENDHTVLSRSLGEILVKGDTVQYTLTEWLDPRIVGPGATQPRVTHWTAHVLRGKLISLIQDPLAD